MTFCLRRLLLRFWQTQLHSPESKPYAISTSSHLFLLECLQGTKSSLFHEGEACRVVGAELPVVPREKSDTGAAAGENTRDAPVIASV